MTASRDPDRLIRAFLDEGLDELPDPVYDVVRNRIEQTRQRAFIGPWRTLDMNRYLQIGLAAAAVVVIAVVAFKLLPGSPAPGVEPSATPEPTSTPTATAEPSPSEAAGLPVGSSHVLWDAPGDVGISVTIPAPGWSGEVGGGVLCKNDGCSDPPDGAGIIVFQGPLYVYGDSCRWSTTTPDKPATTVDELITALQALSLRDPSTPHIFAVEIGGYTGEYMSLDVPYSVDFALCDRGEFRSWVGDLALDNARYHQGPGQGDALYILNVNGLLMVIDIGHYAGTPEEAMVQAEAIVNSATFQLP